MVKVNWTMLAMVLCLMPTKALAQLDGCGEVDFVAPGSQAGAITIALQVGWASNGTVLEDHAPRYNPGFAYAATGAIDSGARQLYLFPGGPGSTHPLVIPQEIELFVAITGAVGGSFTIAGDGGTTRHQGYCTNGRHVATLLPDGTEAMDYRLVNPIGDYVDELTQQVVVAAGVGFARFHIHCMDFGGIGHFVITASVTVDLGNGPQPWQQNGIPFSKCFPTDHSPQDDIANWWAGESASPTGRDDDKARLGVDGHGVPITPAHAQSGDGLNVFEEWRGIEVAMDDFDKTLVRTDPDIKDGFLFDMPGATHASVGLVSIPLTTGSMSAHGIRWHVIWDWVLWSDDDTNGEERTLYSETVPNSTTSGFWGGQPLIGALNWVQADRRTQVTLRARAYSFPPSTQEYVLGVAGAWYTGQRSPNANVAGSQDFSSARKVHCYPILVDLERVTAAAAGDSEAYITVLADTVAHELGHLVGHDAESSEVSFSHDLEERAFGGSSATYDASVRGVWWYDGTGTLNGNTWLPGPILADPGPDCMTRVLTNIVYYEGIRLEQYTPEEDNERGSAALQGVVNYAPGDVTGTGTVTVKEVPHTTKLAALYIQGHHAADLLQGKVLVINGIQECLLDWIAHPRKDVFVQTRIRTSHEHIVRLHD